MTPLRRRRHRTRIPDTVSVWTLKPVRETVWHTPEPPGHVRWSSIGDLWETRTPRDPPPAITLTVTGRHGLVIATNGWHPVAIRHILYICITS